MRTTAARCATSSARARRALSSTSRRSDAATLFVLGVALLVTACGGIGGLAPAAPPPVATPEAARLTAFRYTLSAQASNLQGAPGGGTGDAGGVPITVVVNGEVVAVDRQRSRTSLGLGFGTIDSDRVQIGDRTWTRDGAGPWVEERTDPDLTATHSLGLSLDPGVLLGPEGQRRLQAVLSGVEPTPDQVGGLEAARYTLTSAQVRTLLGAAEGSATASLSRMTEQWSFWVAKEGWFPLRLTAEAQVEQGGQVRLDLALRDHNAPDIMVEPPK